MIRKIQLHLKSLALQVWLLLTLTPHKGTDSPNTAIIFVVFHTLSYCNFLISPVHFCLQTLGDLQVLHKHKFLILSRALLFCSAITECIYTVYLLHKFSQI